MAKSIVLSKTILIKNIVEGAKLMAKNKDVKVEVNIEKRDVDLTSYKVNITVSTNDSIVMEWLANQGAIDTLNNHLSKSIIEYFEQSSKDVKDALATRVKEQKSNKNVAKKSVNVSEKES